MLDDVMRMSVNVTDFDRLPESAVTLLRNTQFGAMACREQQQMEMGTARTNLLDTDPGLTAQ